MTEEVHAVDIRVDGGSWTTAVDDIDSVVRTAAAAALRESLRDDHRAELSILLTDSRTVRTLNEVWRGKPGPTNVLSFPGDTGPLPDGGLSPIGDVVLAFEVLEREARDAEVAFAHHVSHLVVHGVLHLVGYDHMTDEDARRMEQFEARILNSLGISDPYRRDEPEPERAPA